MGDPPRLLDDGDLSPLGRSLLSSASDDGPSGDNRAAIARRLGIAATTIASGTQAATIATGTVAWWKISLVVVALLGIAGVAVVAIPSSEPPVVKVAPVALETPVVKPPPVVAPPVVSPAVVEPPPVVDPPVVEPPPVAKKRTKPTVKVATPVEEPAAPPPTPTIDPRRLAAEVALLDRARGALRAGKHADALAVLDDHDREFASDGALLAEAEVVRIEVLMKQGNVAAAKGRAGEFSARFPHSPLVRRVRHLIEEAP